mgnify:CR=1 FL=1
MTIKEVEEKTHLSRSNIYFYEKEKLIEPVRNTNNGYRKYSEEDVETIEKIAFLRTLDISIEDIRKVLAQEIELNEIISEQCKKLENHIEELELAKSICTRMLQSDNLNINNLEVEKYTGNVVAYWKKNPKVFKLDTISFIYMWSGSAIGILITVICCLVAIFAYPRLPGKIPVQWSEGYVASTKAKEFIFAYPIFCILIQIFIKPIVVRKLQMNMIHSESITGYIINYMCFVAFSVQVFTFLYMAGILKHITNVLLVDIVVFAGILIISWIKMEKDKV